MEGLSLKFEAQKSAKAQARRGSARRRKVVSAKGFLPGAQKRKRVAQKSMFLAVLDYEAVVVWLMK